MSPYDVILIVWDTFANNAARRGGALFITINYFGLSKVQLLLKLIRKIEIIHSKINHRFCASLFNLKFVPQPVWIQGKVS